MPISRAILEDLLALAESAIAPILGSATGGKPRRPAAFFQDRFGAVSREEFDAMRAMIARARDAQEDLADRLTAIETKLNLSSAAPKAKKVSSPLRSVKQKKGARKRA